MSAVDRITATLAKHYDVTPTGVSWPHWRCRCGHTLTHNGFAPEAEHAAHVAERIAAADDLAVLSLPKPDDDSEWGKVWYDDMVLGTVQVRPDGRIESRADFEYEHTLAEMRAAAGVAAAAVKAAEAVSDRG